MASTCVRVSFNHEIKEEKRMTTYIKKRLIYATTLVVFSLFQGARIFGQDSRKYSSKSNNTLSGEGLGSNDEARILAASQLKDPIVQVNPKDLDGNPLIDFTRLACFNYDDPDGDGGMGSAKKTKRKKTGIPDSVLKLNGTSLAVPGFMIPMDQDGNGTKCSYFILARNQMTCCFGVPPSLNEWVSVRMEKGKFADLEMDRPVVIVGTLEVGEVYNVNSGWSFYRMKGEKVIVAGKKKVWFQ